MHAKCFRVEAISSKNWEKQTALMLHAKIFIKEDLYAFRVHIRPSYQSSQKPEFLMLLLLHKAKRKKES